MPWFKNCAFMLITEARTRLGKRGIVIMNGVLPLLLCLPCYLNRPVLNACIPLIFFSVMLWWAVATFFAPPHTANGHWVRNDPKNYFTAEPILWFVVYGSVFGLAYLSLTFLLKLCSEAWKFRRISQSGRVFRHYVSWSLAYQHEELRSEIAPSSFGLLSPNGVNTVCLIGGSMYWYSGNHSSAVIVLLLGSAAGLLIHLFCLYLRGFAGFKCDLIQATAEVPTKTILSSSQRNLIFWAAYGSVIGLLYFLIIWAHLVIFFDPLSKSGRDWELYWKCLQPYSPVEPTADSTPLSYPTGQTPFCAQVQSKQILRQIIEPVKVEDNSDFLIPNGGLIQLSFSAEEHAKWSTPEDP